MDWYPRNPRDFDMGTLGWTIAERGAYSCLIDAYYMNEGPLPDDDYALAALLRVSVDEWQNLGGKVRVKFRPEDGFLHHDRCDEELAKQQKLSRVSRENGKRGGRPKANKNNKVNPAKTQWDTQQGTQKKPQDKTGHNNTPSLRSGDAREEADEFATWYAEYPHKVGKPEALKAFRKARQKVDLQTLLDGLRRYVATKPPDRNYCNPATWLNQERWLDEEAPVANRNSNHDPTSPCNPAGRGRFTEAAERLQRERDVSSGMGDGGGAGDDAPVVGSSTTAGRMDGDGPASRTSIADDCDAGDGGGGGVYRAAEGLPDRCSGEGVRGRGAEPVEHAPPGSGGFPESSERGSQIPAAAAHENQPADAGAVAERLPAQANGRGAGADRGGVPPRVGELVMPDIPASLRRTG